MESVELHSINMNLPFLEIEGFIFADGKEFIVCTESEKIENGPFVYWNGERFNISNHGPKDQKDPILNMFKIEYRII